MGFDQAKEGPTWLNLVVSFYLHYIDGGIKSFLSNYKMLFEETFTASYVLFRLLSEARKACFNFGISALKRNSMSLKAGIHLFIVVFLRLL